MRKSRMQGLVSQDFSGQNRAQGLGFTTFGFWILASIEPWELWFRLLSSLFELMCLGFWALGSEFEVWKGGVPEIWVSFD